jgi:predicted DNA-binding transcriptional regulator YafY
MSDTPARLLRLLSLLQNARDWPGSELAERLDVSGRTIRRDVERLRSLGYPVEATVGSVGGYRLAAGAAMPPLLLDDDEALAIALGLRTVVGQAIGGVDEASVRALAKLQQVLPARLRARMNALSTATMQMPMPTDRTPLDLDVLTEIASAIRERRRIRFDYRAGDGRQSLRLVEPQGLVVTGRRWYLAAYDVDRDDWRIFRVDRVDDPRPLAGGSAPRPLPAADTATFVQDKLYTLAPTYEAVATLQMPAAEATNRIGEFTGDIESIDDRRCRVRLASDTLGWLGVRLMLLGCDFTVEEPPELVAYLRDLGERVIRAGA